MPIEIVSKSIKSNKDLLQLHALNPQRYPFLLESLVNSPSSRFNILFAFPKQTITNSNADFLANLPTSFSNQTAKIPFTGGWFLMLDYELNQEIEPSLGIKHHSKSYAVRIPAAIVQDKKTNKTTFVAEANYEDYLQLMQQDFKNATELKPTNNITINFVEDSSEKFLTDVNKIKQYIIVGDVFQVNLSRQWQAYTDKQPFQIYQKLRTKNPASFAGLAVHNDFAIISSSPERLVKVESGIIETRPIAGTRPRSKNFTNDKNLANELLAHPKEQAEHIMLLDLERNDLGRVCEYGSVKVDELMALESYAHVHHIVSNIKGKLTKTVKPKDIIKAVFPGGTITGCPKVRCMEIINELEQSPRGAYTGSIGYLSNNGNMDLNILIRTIEQNGSHVKFRAGSGIVYDSVPKYELKETRAKALGLML